MMARAPLTWRTILVLENIKSSSMLYTKAVEHEESLLTISKNQSTTVITTDNLVSTLRNMGYTLEKPKFHYNFPQNKQVYITKGQLDIVTPPSTSKEAFTLMVTPSENPLDMMDQVLVEVYQVLKRRQCTLPPGGYMFSKNNHVTTKMGRLPHLVNAMAVIITGIRSAPTGQCIWRRRQSQVTLPRRRGRTSITRVHTVYYCLKE